MSKHVFSVDHLGWIFLLILFTTFLAGCGPEMTSVAVDSQSVSKTTVLSSSSSASAFQSPIPTPIRSPIEGKPPLCEFKEQFVPEQISHSRLQDFVFSKPQVVLTNTAVIGIASWLPDNQRLLITREIPQSNRQTIEIFNSRNGDIRRYAEREGQGGNIPVWLPQSQAVAYATWVDDYRRTELRISRGDPMQTEQVAPNIDWFSLASIPDGEQFSYLSPSKLGRPQLRNSVGQAKTEILSVDMSAWLPPRFLDNNPYGFRAAWQPNGSIGAFYAYPVLFLVDRAVNRACEIQLEDRRTSPSWVYNAKWSPDGRFLAMITTAGLRGELLSFTDLTVLNLQTGEQRHPKVESIFVWDITWAPDSRHLLILGETEKTRTRPVVSQLLFLVDTLTDDSRPVLSDYIFEASSGPGEQLSWASDGRTIAIKCPYRPEYESAMLEDRLCLISVNIQSQ